MSLYACVYAVVLSQMRVVAAAISLSHLVHYKAKRIFPKFIGWHSFVVTQQSSLTCLRMKQSTVSHMFTTVYAHISARLEMI